jgi:hypothetical protein
MNNKVERGWDGYMGGSIVDGLSAKVMEGSTAYQPTRDQEHLHYKEQPFHHLPNR